MLLRVSVFLVIGAILFLLFDRFGPYQSGRGYQPRPIERIGDGEVTLVRAFDGHFHANGRITGRNGVGVPVAFLVDTGASTIAIGERLAERLDLGPCKPRRYGTAAGAVDGCEAVAEAVEVAGLRLHDVRVAVLPGNVSTLLGMNVLRHFRIEQHGATMILRPAE